MHGSSLKLPMEKNEIADWYGAELRPAACTFFRGVALMVGRISSLLCGGRA